LKSIVEVLLKRKMVYKVLKAIYELNNEGKMSIGVRQLGEKLGYRNLISKILKYLQNEGLIEIVSERVNSKRKPRKVAYLTKKGEILLKEVKKRKIFIIKQKLKNIKKEIDYL